MTELADLNPRFALDDAVALLARTPATLDAMLRGLPAWWTTAHEGPDTWSPFDVVGHLIHGEETDWIPRVMIILEDGESRTFDKFNREAQFETSQPPSLGDRLDQFAALRRENLKRLSELKLTAADLDRTGRHPAFGVVTLRQLLATWVAHDLDHVMQIARVLGHQYASDVGPWRAYLRIISGQQG
jgi:DinB family protein